MRKKVEALTTELRRMTELAHTAIDRTVVDRSADEAGLHAALLAFLGWMVVEAHCVTAGLTTATPHGVGPNIRSMVEALITARYLTNDSEAPSELERRLERYYRAVRKEQVKLRSALDDYPVLKKTFLVDEALATRERDELKFTEAALPPSEKLKGAHWSGLPNGLKSVAESVGLGGDYRIQCRLHSGALHGNRPWDLLKLEPTGRLGIPDLNSGQGLVVPLAFDALRYLAWMVKISATAGAIALYRSEQKYLSEQNQFLQPLETLLSQGIVGPSPTGGS